jgi:hypothetical protein
VKLARVFPFVVALFFVASPARAVPMLVQLADVLKADTIVIAKVHGSSASGVDLDVERALRGTAAGAFHATMPTSGAASPWAVGTRLVAFVSHGVWTTAAIAPVGTLETSVLRFEALPVCCDATGISPAIATLAQIEAAVRGSALAWTFRGNLELGGARSTIDIEALAPSNVVRGLPAMAGYAAPTVQVGYGAKGAVVITWNVSTRRAAPLRIVGDATGKNADGSIAITYRVIEPSVMNERDFRRFVADASLSQP